MARLIVLRLLLPLFLFSVPLESLPAQTFPPVVRPPAETISLVGKWRWMDNQVVTVGADFAFTAGNGRKGTWKLKDKTPRTYILTWDGGVFVDELTLSADGKKVIGRNNKDKKIKGDRIE